MKMKDTLTLDIQIASESEKSKRQQIENIKEKDLTQEKLTQNDNPGASRFPNTYPQYVDTYAHDCYLSAQCRESYAYRSIHMYVVNIKYTVFQYD